MQTPEPRYIDAKFILNITAGMKHALVKDKGGYRWLQDEDKIAYGRIVAFEELVNKAPTIYRKEDIRRRGHWIEVSRTEHAHETELEEKCAVCGRYVQRFSTQPEYNYCPSCGADMSE